MMMAARLLLSLLLVVVLVSSSVAIECYQCGITDLDCADYSFDPDDVDECEGSWCVKFRAEASGLSSEYKDLHDQSRPWGGQLSRTSH